MINEILSVILWTTAILLIISGIDDLYLDLLYWLLKGRHKSKLPNFSAMHDKPEKPIAIFLGAWNESGVIGRTLSYAVQNIKYKNFKIFVGVYPNDTKTINAVKDISLKDSRVIACINPQNGPTTKADNLNSLYTGLCEYEKIYGEFEILIVHDAEDFIHPYSMRLYNYLIGYKGYHGIQIPVIPIKSKHGNIYHRTYCDAFAEIHTKDMVVRQGMGTFIPFSGTGMGFHRKAIYYLEMYYNKIKSSAKPVEELFRDEYLDLNGRKIELTEDYFGNNEEIVSVPLHANNTSYLDDPFASLIKTNKKYTTPAKGVIRRYTTAFTSFALLGIGFLVYTGSTENKDNSMIGIKNGKSIFFENVYAGDDKSSDYYTYEPNYAYQTTLTSKSPAIENKGYIYTDKNYNVVFVPVESGKFDKNNYEIYLPIEDGKFGVQPSTWSSTNETNNPINSIILRTPLNNINGIIGDSKKTDKTLFKIKAGSNKNLEEDQNHTKKVSEIFQK
jgi:hypothetical protein